MRYLRTMSFSAIVVVWGAGCGEPSVEMVSAPVTHSPVMLFDPEPGPPLASGLMYRGDWPAAESANQLGEVIFYQERFIDMQYSSPFGRWSQDRTYRRFSTFRVGSGVR